MFNLVLSDSTLCVNVTRASNLHPSVFLSTKVLLCRCVQLTTLECSLFVSALSALILILVRAHCSIYYTDINYCSTVHNIYIFYI